MESKTHLLSLAVVGSLLASSHSSPASAGTGVPKRVQISDPAGDANYLNDEGRGGDSIPMGRDNVTPVDASEAGDILKVWFTNDASTISVHIQTEAPPPAAAPIFYYVFSNPESTDIGPSPCIALYAWVGGDGDRARVRDYCFSNESSSDETGGAAAKFRVEALGDGTGIVTITAERRTSVAFMRGAALHSTVVAARSTTGYAQGNFVNFPDIDNTKPGRTYKLKG